MTIFLASQCDDIYFTRMSNEVHINYILSLGEKLWRNTDANSSMLRDGVN